MPRGTPPSSRLTCCLLLLLLSAASTCVGTVEARSVTVPIVDLQPALKLPQNFYYSAACKAIHVEDRVVECCSGAGAGGGSGWSGESEG